MYDPIVRRLFENREVSLYEMANVSKSDTKLPYDVWIDSAGQDRNVPHNTPRIKVKAAGEMVSISISMTPVILAGNDFKGSSEVFNWVRKYYDVLMKHWQKKLTDKQALNLLGD